MGADFIFTIAVLILSVVIHEVSHGFTAYLFNDPTAKLEGRLTLNPIKHIDPVGSFIVPVLGYMLGGFIFGWAKPVPYNPYNLSRPKISEPLVAASGSIVNLSLAILFGLLIRFSGELGIANPGFIAISSTIVIVNLVLAVFNMIPIPPLDGSRVLFSLLPYRFHRFQAMFEGYGMVLVILFIFILWPFISPLVRILFQGLTGMSV